MEIEEFLKSKGLFYTRELINIMDETINLPKIMEEYAKLYHESELKKLRVGDVSSRREQLRNMGFCENKIEYNCDCVSRCGDYPLDR